MEHVPLSAARLPFCPLSDRSQHFHPGQHHCVALLWVAVGSLSVLWAVFEPRWRGGGWGGGGQLPTRSHKHLVHVGVCHKSFSSIYRWSDSHVFQVMSARPCQNRFGHAEFVNVWKQTGSLKILNFHTFFSFFFPKLASHQLHDSYQMCCARNCMGLSIYSVIYVCICVLTPSVRVFMCVSVVGVLTLLPVKGDLRPVQSLSGLRPTGLWGVCVYQLCLILSSTRLRAENRGPIIISSSR